VSAEPVRVAALGEIAPGKSKKFVLPVGRLEVECFVVNFRGEHRAFVNKCRHVAMSLDWVENRFFDETGDYLLCPTHGAVYEPEGGLCVAGPPAGKSLVAVPLEERDGALWASAPANSEDVL
jgi:nitrite reductase/ring-hydroxylating ferredoxin subunit